MRNKQVIVYKTNAHTGYKKELQALCKLHIKKMNGLNAPKYFHPGFHGLVYVVIVIVGNFRFATATKSSTTTRFFH
jgi:hypothetical protein